MPLDWMVRLYPAEWRERYADEMLALLAQIRASPRTALDLALGAVDAWLQPWSPEQELPGSVNPLRNASVTVFCAWVAFVLAGLIFYATLDDNPLTTLGQSTLGLGLSVLVVEAGAALSLLAVLAGAAPIGLALLREAMAGRRRDSAWLMFGVPLLCAGILAAYLAGMALRVGGHPEQGFALFILFQVLCVLATLCSTAAISAAVLHSERRSGPFRLARAAALPASLSMVLTLLGLVMWGASAVTAAPAVFYTSPGWLILDTAHAWLLASVVMAAATAVALLTTIRAFAHPGAGAAPKA
jgi:hypothetical protein